jgi:hypothetical protein
MVIFERSKELAIRHAHAATFSMKIPNKELLLLIFSIMNFLNCASSFKIPKQKFAKVVIKRNLNRIMFEQAEVANLQGDPFITLAADDFRAFHIDKVK